jgi:hypothetical protein
VKWSPSAMRIKIDARLITLKAFVRRSLTGPASCG